VQDNCRAATHFVKSASGISSRLAGVSMTERSTAFTVTPFRFGSSAKLSVSRWTAALAAV
jgi:hypothetical protein